MRSNPVKWVRRAAVTRPRREALLLHRGLPGGVADSRGSAELTHALFVWLGPCSVPWTPSPGKRDRASGIGVLRSLPSLCLNGTLMGLLGSAEVRGGSEPTSQVRDVSRGLRLRWQENTLMGFYPPKRRPPPTPRCHPAQVWRSSALSRWSRAIFFLLLPSCPGREAGWDACRAHLQMRPRMGIVSCSGPQLLSGTSASLLFAEALGTQEREVTQSCPTLCEPKDCSLPGSSVHGIFQARVLEWVAISFSRGSSQPRDRTRVSHIVGRRFTA